ncbi:MAG TPA: metallophosphoesterase [Solirubrobacteraceae bacterium]|nr:metallophosphoesterase [Solirubrobacteraceae bacterium]
MIRRGLIAAGAAAAVYAGWIEPRRLITVRQTLALPHWPRALDGLRIGLLTDIHAGALHAGPGQIARAVRRLNAEAPDAIVLLGDFIDAHPLWGGRIDPLTIARELAALDAPLGTFAVLGNHDWKQTGDRMWTALRDAGITVLENSTATAGGVHVAGLADLRMRRPDLPGTLAQVPNDAPTILLAHDPDVFPFVPHRVALTLSGHTHGGQVAIPVLRRPAIPSYYGERYARGHVVEDGRHLYISSGLGTSGLPIRFLAPPEIVILSLRPARLRA